MAVMKLKRATTVAGTWLNEAVSFIVFCVLDILDSLLCLLYKAADYLFEAEWKPCYCLSAKEPITTTRGKILLSHNNGESKILTLSPLQELGGRSKIELEDVSETLYIRPSLLSDFSSLSVTEINKRFVKVTRSETKCSDHHEKTKNQKRRSITKSSLTVNFTVVEMLRGKIRPQNLSHDVSRWSDCDCGFCTSWASTSNKDHSLFVKTQIPNGITAKEDVLFIHGFISSSAFWTETVFPSLLASSSAYRLFAVDLLGFGKSPKPADSLYTLREHVEMIEKSVLHKHNVKSFHIVAHSLGCILALSLAARHGSLIKSLTLLAPPYYPVPAGEAEPRQYVMKKVAPRKVWPPIALGASMACWYEHISRTICLLICKHHRIWQFLANLVTRNNRTVNFLIEGFMCHTHNAAWHTLHNIICGTGSKLDMYLDIVRDKLKCNVTIFHGGDDELIPVECSYNVKQRIPRARVKVIEHKDHITMVVGRQDEFARELQEIWKTSSC
ncbi:putative lysophospholipase BODYGUARD 3 [Cardamine amara subsp. amara]|uniref:Lysophospholipase BODYGUARD 3 n=1 Tax=Cardamine amara subsp. amara TaxID=228776 RepID=A0ABD1BZR1_CARAN